MKTRQATENRIPTVEKMIIMDVRLAWTVFITMTTLTPSYGMPTVMEEEGGASKARKKKRREERDTVRNIFGERTHAFNIT